MCVLTWFLYIICGNCNTLRYNPDSSHHNSGGFGGDVAVVPQRMHDGDVAGGSYGHEVIGCTYLQSQYLCDYETTHAPLACYNRN